MPEEVFDILEEAFQYVVDRLIPERRNYIINARCPEVASSQAATIQIVSENMVYENGEVGLTIHLPFDPASGTFTHLIEFVGTGLDALCDEYKYDGIPCFAIRLGTNVVLAEKVARFILLHIYEYSSLADFQFEVYDEGPLRD